MKFSCILDDFEFLDIFGVMLLIRFSYSFVRLRRSKRVRVSSSAASGLSSTRQAVLPLMHVDPITFKNYYLVCNLYVCMCYLNDYFSIEVVIPISCMICSKCLSLATNLKLLFPLMLVLGGCYRVYTCVCELMLSHA